MIKVVSEWIRKLQRRHSADFNRNARKLQIVLASARADDYQNLQTILEGTQWAVIQTNSCDATAKVLDTLSVPIVFWDRDLPGYQWTEILLELTRRRRGTGIILLSSVADPYLWDNVTQHGGFDVLTRPFERSQVLSVLAFVHAHWKTAWPTRQVRSAV